MDGLAASLPSQEAFELPSLGHSVLTYTRLRPYPDRYRANEWTVEEIRQFRRAQRETTQYLTNGRQHALDVINGHSVSLASSTGKRIEIEPKMELDELREALDNLPRSRRPYDR